jgi:iron(III) transport system ATP-binding protein
MSFLVANALSKAYGAVRALIDADLTVAKGGRTAIVGPSGSGKTTLLRLIAGFEIQDAGSIALDGVELANGTASMPAHKRNIGFVPQDGALFPHLDVAANIGFGLPRDFAGRDARIDTLLDLVELGKAMRHRRPHELSGGQQQRVALARALAREPKLMLLDEPFSALDTGLRAAMRKAVAEVLAKVGATAILVTHDQAEALSFADQVAVMREGRLVQAGAPEDLYRRPIDKGVAAFMGEALFFAAKIDGAFADCVLGRVPVENANGVASGEIFVRPEQLRLVAPGDPASVARARVAGVEFSGPSSSVTLKLANGGNIAVPCASAFRPDPGDAVGIALTGTARLI